MKLVIFADTHPFFTSSASANRVGSLLGGLTRLGVSVQLCIVGGYKSRSERGLMGKCGLFKGVHYQYFSQVLLDTIWKRRYHKYIGKRLNLFILNKRIGQVVRQADVNTVIWVNFDYNILKRLHQFKQGYPSIKYFTELSEYLDIHHFNESNALQKRSADQEQVFFEQTFYSDLDGLALMTNTLFQHYRSHFQHPKVKLLHLPMTVDLDRFTEQQKLLDGFQNPYIAYIGVLNNAKDGIDILLESFAQIASTFPNVNVYLIGPWHYDTPSHLATIKRFGLENRIFWRGEYSRDQIPAILQHADLLVLPRPDSKQAQGGFPTKLGEYLASGKPVCATRVGEIPDYLTDNESVFFAEPGSVDSFADAMSRALSDPDHAARVGQNGRKVAETHFNKDIQAKILYDFLNSL